VHYEVELSPDLTTCTFSGHVAITVEVTEENEALVLNAIDLEVEAATIDGTAVATELDPETERLTLTADSPLSNRRTCGQRLVLGRDQRSSARPLPIDVHR
jgi:aminopeptidase N